MADRRSLRIGVVGVTHRYWTMTTRLFATLMLLSATGFPAAQVSFPENPPPDTIYLPANATGAGRSPLPTVAGELARHSADEVLWNNPSELVLKKAGFHEIEGMLRYPVEPPLVPGRYSVSTRFSQGGESMQTFSFVLGDGTGQSEERLVFSQKARSWDMSWRKAPKPLTIYPGDEWLEITVRGKDTQQKNLGGFLLERIAAFPADLTQEGGALRRQVAQAFTADSGYSLLILESQSGAETDAAFKELAASDLGARFGLEMVFDREAEKLRADLGLGSAPCILLLDGYQAIRHVWKGPFDHASARAMVAALADPAQLSAFPAPAPKPLTPPTELRNGRPAAWLSAGTWRGPGGLSLWGLDYEPTIRPNLGDPCIISRFDTVLQRRWNEEKLAGNSCYVNVPADDDFVWSRGVEYAFLRIHSDVDVPAVLHLAQTGVATGGWLNGHPLSFEPDATAQAQSLSLDKESESSDLDRTDQGAVMEVRRGRAEGPVAAFLDLKAGWNRLLIKLVTQHKKGELFAFKTLLTSPDGQPLPELQTALSDPTPSLISRSAAARIAPLVYTDAPFNMAYEGEPLSLTADLGTANYARYNAKLGLLRRGEFQEEPAPYYPFSGTLELVITDYDGKEILRRSADASFPGKVTFDLGPAPARGYYAARLSLYDKDRNLVTVYAPDGFSVIGGVVAQQARKAEKKMAVTYYFMATKDLYKTVFFPYMQRIGIFRNVGGMNARSIDLYREAAQEGLALSADLWNHRDPQYVADYVRETAPYVDSFKSFNEIDIHPDQRGTPESWVKKAKLDYETVKKFAPDALVLGGSLARAGGDDWFEKCLALGLDNYHDVWDVHCYPQSPPVLEGTMSNGESETELGVLKAMAKVGKKNSKPFWIGETGARASHGYDARRWQADTVAKMLACALSRPDFQKIGFLVPWNYFREFCSVNDIEAGHMPAEAAYYTSSALVDGFSYTPLKLGNEVQAAKFGPTIMAWTTAPRPVEVNLRPEEPGPFVQVDVVGRVTPLAKKEDGSVKVTLTGSPIYVLARQTYDRLTAFSSQ